MSIRTRLLLAVVCFGLVAYMTVTAIRPQAATFDGHTLPVHLVVASPDGKSLASVSRNGQNIRLWDVAIRKGRAMLQDHTDTVNSLAFSPDGTFLASASDDCTVRLWDVDTRKLRATLRGHTARVWYVAVSPDGKTLASVSEDKTVKLWDVLTGRTQGQFLGSELGATPAFSPDSKTLAFRGSDDTIKLGDVTTGKEQATLGRRGYLKCLAFSPDGKTLASADWFSYRGIKLWDVASGKERDLEDPDWLRKESTDFVEYIAFSLDGTTLASGVTHTIGLWDVTSGRNTAAFEREGVCSVSFTPGGKLVALGGRDSYTVKMWELTVLPNEGTERWSPGTHGRLRSRGNPWSGQYATPQVLRVKSCCTCWPMLGRTWHLSEGVTGGVNTKRKRFLPPPGTR
jgi:WD40 repeat protein